MVRLDSVAVAIALHLDANVTDEAKRILDAALQLSTDDREMLVFLLEDSLRDGTPEEIEAAWIEEIKRRIGEIERGEAIMIPAEEAFARTRQILEATRSAKANGERDDQATPR